MYDRNGAKLRDVQLNSLAGQIIDCIYTSNELMIFDQTSKSLIAYTRKMEYTYIKRVHASGNTLHWLSYSQYM